MYIFLCFLDFWDTSDWDDREWTPTVSTRVELPFSSCSFSSMRWAKSRSLIHHRIQRLVIYIISSLFLEEPQIQVSSYVVLWLSWLTCLLCKQVILGSNPSSTCFIAQEHFEDSSSWCVFPQVTRSSICKVLFLHGCLPFSWQPCFLHILVDQKNGGCRLMERIYDQSAVSVFENIRVYWRADTRDHPQIWRAKRCFFSFCFQPIPTGLFSLTYSLSFKAHWVFQPTFPVLVLCVCMCGGREDGLQRCFMLVGAQAYRTCGFLVVIYTRYYMYFMCCGSARKLCFSQSMHQM